MTSMPKNNKAILYKLKKGAVKKQPEIKTEVHEKVDLG